MRISMNVIKNEHGVFHVRKKVPKKLEEATATVTRAVGARLTQISELRSVPLLSAVARVRLARLNACLEDPQLGT
jgi:hypothetical protein